MTKDDIISWAMESGFADSEGIVHAAYHLEAFDNLVAEHEREECANLCEQWDASHPDVLATAIRARGNT